MLQEVIHEIKNTITEILQGVHTAIPGKIVKYNPDKCEAEILPYAKYRAPNGEYIDFPQLNSVSVMFPQSCGQSLTIAYPINPDDECLILIQEQTLDIWRGAGAESDNDLRFDLTNAIAIPGLFARPNPVVKEAQEQNALIIAKSKQRITITDESISISGNMAYENDLTVNGDLKVLGDIGITQNLTVDGDAAVNGNVNINGNTDISGTLTLAGIDMNNHKHSGVTAGGDYSGPPK